MEVAILGGGNFGTAIANIVASNGHPTHLWMRDVAQVEECRTERENRRYLPGHLLVPLVSPTADLERSVGRSRLVIVSVPSASFREVAAQMAPHAGPGCTFVSATKGIERERRDSGATGFKLMSQILEEVTGSHRVGVLSGPNLAEEIADRQYTGTVIASRDPDVCVLVQTTLKNETLRVYANDDVYGVELGGALKNIYAIVCGMAAGMSVGQNTIGMLITRALAEMSRFAVRLGANPYTFLGLAGVGDLMVTCTSPLSRNYQLGYRLGQGMSMDEALEDLGKLAEGVNTLRVIYEVARDLDVYMPLVTGMYRYIFERVDLGELISELMTGGNPQDVEFVRPT
jgi:glycerol-3-phosphate dehydrogenase (NAD(P)+)